MVNRRRAGAPMVLPRSRRVATTPDSTSGLRDATDLHIYIFNAVQATEAWRQSMEAKLAVRPVGGDFEPGVDVRERPGVAAGADVRHDGFERDVLFDERDLHLLSVRRERMLVQDQGHARLMA